MTVLSSGGFQPRMEILPLAQQALWPELQKSIRLGFTLYGGTAVALRLGHRTSVDFDFFSSAPLDRAAIDAAFPFMVRSTVLQDQPNSLTVLVPIGHSTQSQDAESDPQHVKLSFFGTIAFGRVAAPDVTDDEVLQVASLDDLMATKLKVILQRAEAKDYRDIAAMVNAVSRVRDLPVVTLLR
jgi:predicted nucleotidyltransferase component of viral defense system